MDLNRAYAETFGFIGEQSDPGDETSRPEPATGTPTFSREPLKNVLDELKPLIARHWREIAVHQDIPLDPDWDRYFRMEAAGAFHFFAARVDGRLVGYAPFLVAPHLHYKSSKWAQNDIIWIAPEHRCHGLGHSLVAFALHYLRRQGVQVVSIDAKTAHPALSAMLDGMNFARVEVGHQIRIG